MNRWIETCHFKFKCVKNNVVSFIFYPSVCDTQILKQEYYFSSAKYPSLNESNILSATALDKIIVATSALVACVKPQNVQNRYYIYFLPEICLIYTKCNHRIEQTIQLLWGGYGCSCARSIINMCVPDFNAPEIPTTLAISKNLHVSKTMYIPSNPVIHKRTTGLERRKSAPHSPRLCLCPNESSNPPLPLPSLLKSITQSTSTYLI